MKYMLLPIAAGVAVIALAATVEAITLRAWAHAAFFALGAVTEFVLAELLGRAG